MGEFKSQFIIAAPSSNAGKTTITLGLLRLLRNKGISVQPFKVGPDFIDPKFHKQACGKTGINLDLFMMSKQHIQEQLHFYGKDQEVNCIEGVMGLFDGAVKSDRSTADLAIRFNIPVILVVDAKAVAYSVAPLIKGFKEFDPRLNLLGVIFNRVSSDNHYTYLKDACTDIEVHSFGYVKQLDDLGIPSRHLGLNIDAIDQFEQSISSTAYQMEHTVDYKKLIKSALSNASNEIYKPSPFAGKLKISIAQDKAFNFLYPQHVKKLKEYGKVTFFSPLKDTELPESDFVYIPGGYPELYLEQLSNNTSMHNSIKNYAKSNGLCFAECGGLMYLGKTIVDEFGKTFEMVNVFDFETSMQHTKLHLGYRHINLEGLDLKAHEFHYSTILPNSETSFDVMIKSASGININTPIYKKKGFTVTYLHLYLGEKDAFKLLLNILKK